MKAATAWLATVAQSTPARIGHGRRKRAASMSERSWVRSPISATATVDRLIRKDSIGEPRAERVERPRPRAPAARVPWASAVGLAMPRTAPYAMSGALKYVDVRPGSAPGGYSPRRARFLAERWPAVQAVPQAVIGVCYDCRFEIPSLACKPLISKN